MKRGALVEQMKGTIVADETYIDGEPKNRQASQRGAATSVPAAPGTRGSHTDKTPVLSLINRDTGEVRSRIIPNVTGATLGKALGEQHCVFTP